MRILPEQPGPGIHKVCEQNVNDSEAVIVTEMWLLEHSGRE